jgi:hypothetical protein
MQNWLVGRASVEKVREKIERVMQKRVEGQGSEKKSRRTHSADSAA